MALAGFRRGFAVCLSSLFTQRAGFAAVLQLHQRGPDKFSLKGVSRGDGFIHQRAVGRFGFAAGKPVALFIERLFRSGDKRREADAARGIAAGVLKMSKLLDESRLARME